MTIEEKNSVNLLQLLKLKITWLISRIVDFAIIVQTFKNNIERNSHALLWDTKNFLRWLIVPQVHRCWLPCLSWSQVRDAEIQTQRSGDCLWPTKRWGLWDSREPLVLQQFRKSVAADVHLGCGICLQLLFSFKSRKSCHVWQQKWIMLIEIREQILHDSTYIRYLK